MRVGVYGRVDQPGLEPLLQGFTGCGHRVQLRRLSAFTPDQMEDFDAVVVYGKRGAGRSVIDTYRHRCPLFVFDFASLMKPMHPTAWSLHPGDLNRIAAGPCDGSRAWLLPPRLEVRPKGNRVLLCGPTRRDAGHPFDENGLRQWLSNVAFTLLGQGFEVVWRPHPNDVWTLDGVKPSSPYTPIETTLTTEPWAALATYASTTGWTALMAGLPVYCSNDAGYADVAQCDFSLPPKPAAAEDLEAVLRRLTWTVFLEEEMRSGLAPSFLVKQAEEWRAAA